MTTANKKELIIGVAMLGVSATYMVMAYRLPGHEGIDAATVPSCWPPCSPARRLPGRQRVRRQNPAGE